MVEVLPSLSFAWLQLSGRRRIPAASEGRDVGRTCHRTFRTRTIRLWPEWTRAMAGHAKRARRGIYNVVFSYHEEEVGRYAGSCGGSTLPRSRGREVDLTRLRKDIADDIQQMREIREEVRFGPSTGSLVEEAETRDIPFIRLNDQSLVQLGYGVHQKTDPGNDDRQHEHDRGRHRRK